MIQQLTSLRHSERRRAGTKRVRRAVMFCLCLAPGISATAQTAEDSLSPPPTEPVLSLAVRGSFDVPRAHSGDTVRYRLRVEWNEIPAAVRVLPPHAGLETSGLRVTGLSTTHHKNMSGGNVRNVTEFTYTLVAGDPGTARIAPFTLRYRSGLSSREETAAVQGAILKVLPPRVAPWQHPVFQVLLLLLIAGIAAILLVRRLRRVRAARGPAPDRLDTSFAKRMEMLKRRCDGADSRAWITDAERLCVDHLCRRLGVSNAKSVRFEAALDRYLARKPEPGPAETESWTKLRDLFHESRYAGARTEAHALRDACRHLKICLQPGEEKTS